MHCSAWTALFAAAVSYASAKDYTTYIGDAFPYSIAALATDSAGNTYLTGSRWRYSYLSDLFVTKLDASGNLVFTVIFSDDALSQGNAIALDPSGNIVIAGVNGRANLMKLSPNGSLLWSTYVGGTLGWTRLNAVAVDDRGDIYVTEETTASDYPHTPGLPAGYAGLGVPPISAALFAKLSSAGDKILYGGAVSAGDHLCVGGSSCLLSFISTSGVAIAVDAAGDAYIAGDTFGGGLEGTAGTLLPSGTGAFVLKVTAAGNGLGYLTFLGNGTTGFTSAAAIAVDTAGNVHVAGMTSDTRFPATPGSFQPSLAIPQQQSNPPAGPPPDAYIAKLNSTGTAMIWATFLGGTAREEARGIAVDPAGNVWVSGTTASPDFPTTGGFPQGQDFLAELNSTGSTLLSSTRYPVYTTAAAIGLDPSGTVHAAGDTGIVSAITPGPAGPRILGVASAAGGNSAGLVAPGELISIYGLQMGPATPVSSTFDSSGFLPTALGGVQVVINGNPAPLLYVSDTQINAVVPFGLSTNAPIPLKVTVNGMMLPDYRLFVNPAAPDVFRNPDGTVAAINQDGTVNSRNNPAKQGSIVSIWATGASVAGGIDGQRQTGALSNCTCSIQTATGSPLQLLYAGSAPGLVAGVTQINFQLPVFSYALPAGSTLGFVLSVSGQASDQAAIFVAP